MSNATLEEEMLVKTPFTIVNSGESPDTVTSTGTDTVASAEQNTGIDSDKNTLIEAMQVIRRYGEMCLNIIVGIKDTPPDSRNKLGENFDGLINQIMDNSSECGKVVDELINNAKEQVIQTLMKDRWHDVRNLISPMIYDLEIWKDGVIDEADAAAYTNAMNDRAFGFREMLDDLNELIHFDAGVDEFTAAQLKGFKILTAAHIDGNEAGVLVTNRIILGIVLKLLALNQTKHGVKEGKTININLGDEETRFAFDNEINSMVHPKTHRGGEGSTIVQDLLGYLGAQIIQNKRTDCGKRYRVEFSLPNRSIRQAVVQN